MADIQIVMATYKGARFLQQQFDSLLAQTNQNWELLIRDDNSPDATPQIIEQFATQHPDKVRIIHDDPTGATPNKQLGPSQNFGRLLELTDSKYVMFSDQDDVWHPEKIARSLHRMKQLEARHGADKPLLVHTDTSLSDGDNKILAPSINQYRGRKLENSVIGRLLVEEPITGMTMMMNRPLVDKAAPVPPQASMHDSWVSKVAAVTGKIGYIDAPLVAHRTHGANVSGVKANTATLAERATEKFKGGVKAAIRVKGDFYADRMRKAAEIAEVLLDRFGDEMSAPNRLVLSECVEMPHQSAMGQRATMLNRRILPTGLRGKVESLLFTSPADDDKRGRS